ncbi:MAG: hypothetical protein PHQ98_04425 [Candidatus ainarchaeum sp.]|nr:hypothetical protein [Candidatus ainarchaeum sp.]
MTFDVLSARVEKEKSLRFKKLCEIKQMTTSARLKELIESDLKPKIPDYLAGNNIIEYDEKSNSFTWKIKLDLPVTISWNGQTGETNIRKIEIPVAKNLSEELLKDIDKQINDALKTRNEKTNKTKNNSVILPKELVGDEK